MGLFLGFLSCFLGLYFCICATRMLDDCSFVLQSEVRKVDSSSSILLSQDCCGYLGAFAFHLNCEIFCSSSVKNAIGNLIGIALNLQTAFGSIVIFTIWILHTREYGISFHLFMSSLISFISVLYFSVYSSFVPQVSLFLDT